VTAAPPRPPLAITGLGVVCGLGEGREAWTRAWREGRTGLGWLTLVPPAAGPGGNACEYASEAPAGWDWREAFRSRQAYADRASALAVAAARGAMGDAGWKVPLPAGGPAAGLSMGTLYGAVASAGAFHGPVGRGGGKTASALVFSHSYPNSPAALCCIELGLRGHSAVFAGTRDAGLRALLHAAGALARGGRAGITRLLAGAADALSGPVVAHLAAAAGAGPWPGGGGDPPDRVDGVPPAEAARWAEAPGEAGVFFALETAASARERGARALAWWNEPLAREAARRASAIAWRLGDCGAATPLLALAALLLAGEEAPGAGGGGSA